MITGLYDKQEDIERREEWSCERTHILDMQPAPKCRITRYRSAQLVKYYQQWSKAIEAWKTFRAPFEDDPTDDGVYWYDILSTDYQTAKTERCYVYGILHRRGYVYVGIDEWVSPERAAELDATNAWDYEQLPLWERQREREAEKADAERDER